MKKNYLGANMVFKLSTPFTPAQKLKIKVNKGIYHGIGLYNGFIPIWATNFNSGPIEIKKTNKITVKIHINIDNCISTYLDNNPTANKDNIVMRLHTKIHKEKSIWLQEGF